MTDANAGELFALHNVTDRESAIAKAREARIRLTAFAAEAFPPRLDFTLPMMTLMSLLTRAQAFHDGALDAVSNGNPFAAFTLIRGYAENAAVLVYLLKRPDDLKRLLPEAPLDTRIRIGQITNGAGARFGEFKAIYDTLSKFAHPDPRTALAGWRNTDEELGVQWSSAPFFKTDEDQMMACVWLIELAQANAHLWRECWELLFGGDKSLSPSPWETIS